MFGSEPEKPATAAVKRYPILSDEEIELVPPIKFLLGQLLPEKCLGELHGAPGSGKSFLALDIAMCIATGLLWNTRTVKRGSVVYVAAEGSAGIGQRSRAWKHARSFSGSAGVYFITRSVNLRNQAEIALFIGAVQERVPQPVQLIVFDTLARCMIGGDENSSRDMGEAIEGADLVRVALQAAVLMVHHTRKDCDVERGSTALRGAVDVMIALRRENDALLSLTCEKMKDAAQFERIVLRLEPDLGSCVITATTDWQVSTGHLTKNQRAVLESLTRDFESDGTYSSTLQKTSGLQDRTFYRTVTDLVRMEYLASVKEGRAKRYTATSAGRVAIRDKGQIADNKLSDTNRGSMTPPSHLLEMGG